MESLGDCFRPRRSVLYMPGANLRALEKAKTLQADSLILDLEDAVSPDAKELARAQVTAAVGAGGYGQREIIVRINALDTPWGAGDIASAIPTAPSAILVPKVSSGAEVREVAAALHTAGLHEATAIWIMIETPRAILNLAEIAATAADLAIPLACFVLGTNDLAKDTGASLAEHRLGMMAWLSASVVAARAHGLHVIDGVYNDFRDQDGFEAECRQGALLGMDGKTLIHPDQIERANAIFSPKAEDVAWARRIIAAFAEPGIASKGVTTVDGKMVELLHVEVARKTIAIADAIDRRAPTGD